tara:strand:+ start:42 stop:350 length:309 start_codon:yes stop_codon:yes gene_type:complete
LSPIVNLFVVVITPKDDIGCGIFSDCLTSAIELTGRGMELLDALGLTMVRFAMIRFAGFLLLDSLGFFCSGFFLVSGFSLVRSIGAFIIFDIVSHDISFTKY